ncbi:translation initiation factor IF-2-like [Oryza brachyantha]|uniref:translation initiation factor IF-2-like n=1 Tax=Oryza brachyantha TaxID=4533 RepID=UPI001ADD154D|nr:translation initiation factor IF-2-like [Oryza brachyantha]
MAIEAPRLPDLLLTPLRSHHHLAELRVEPAHSAVAFSAPCAGAGRKRRCLLPPSSPRKKVLLELHPFDPLVSPGPSSPTHSAPPLRGSPATAPPLLSSRAGSASSYSPASDFSFPLAAAGGSGSRGGDMFAFLEDAAAAAATPTGSSARALSFLASPGRPEAPMGSTAAGGGGGFSSLALPKRFPVTAGPTANGGFVFFGLPDQPLTPTGSNASGGGASLSYELSLSPEEFRGSNAVPPLPSPTPVSSGSTGSAGFSFFPSPRPAFGNAGSPSPAAATPTGGAAPSPPFVFTAWPAHRSGGGRNRRSRQNLRVATPRRGSTRPRDEQQPVTPPPQKVAKTAAGEASFSSILSGSAGRPCCTFITLPTKAAAKQESNNSSGEASRSPVRPSSSVEKTIAPEREVEVSSAEREAPRASSPAAACTGAAVVVRVTCKCGVHKEFSFDHSH